MEALFHAWDAVGQSPEPPLAFDTWQRYLTVTYGQLADQESTDLLRLFLKHTYLASLARLLIWASLSKGKTTTTLRETAKDILSGRFFEEQRDDTPLRPPSTASSVHKPYGTPISSIGYRQSSVMISSRGSDRRDGKDLG
jgi:hypothetical protein